MDEEAKLEEENEEWERKEEERKRADEERTRRNREKRARKKGRDGGGKENRVDTDGDGSGDGGSGGVVQKTKPGVRKPLQIPRGEAKDDDSNNHAVDVARIVEGNGITIHDDD